MSQSALERLDKRNLKTTLIARITLPDGTKLYLSSAYDPVAEIGFNDGSAVNPVIISVSGLYFSDLSRTTDVSLLCSNKKLTMQSGNPLTAAVKFSDLLASGLDRATVELKELVEAAKPIRPSTFDSDELTMVFTGRIRRPVKYSDDEIRLTATAEDIALRSEYPKEVLGEDAGYQEQPETQPLPVLCGDCSIEDDAGGAGVYTDMAAQPALPFDTVKRLILVSTRTIGELDKLTIKIGDLPTGYLLDDCLEPYTDPDHPAYVIRRIKAVETSGPWTTASHAFFFVFTARCASEPFVDTTYNHEDVAREGQTVELTQDQRLAVMTPVFTNVGEAYCFPFGVQFWIPCEMPEGAELRMDWAYTERKRDGWTDSRYIGVFRRGNLQGGGILTPVVEADSYAWYLNGERGISFRTLTADWAWFRQETGLRITLRRLDSGSDPIVIRGIFARVPAYVPCWFGRFKIAEDWQFGTCGRGIPTSGQEAERCHPRDVIKEVMQTVMGISYLDVDFAPVEWLQPVAGWRFGFSLAEQRSGLRLLEDLAEQATARIVRDPDGKYRFRLLSRYGGQPGYLRESQPLSYPLHIVRPPEIEPLSDETVKNVIVVRYRYDGDEPTRVAWVHGGASDDGYGRRNPVAEQISQSSIQKYGERRLEIDAWAVRDSETACGIRDYYLSRHAEPQTRVTVDVRHIALRLTVGKLVQLDGLDDVLRYNGESWSGKWFEIESIRRRGDLYTLTLLSIPQVDVSPAAMVARRVMVAGG